MRVMLTHLLTIVAYYLHHGGSGNTSVFHRGFESLSVYHSKIQQSHRYRESPVRYC